MITIRKKPLLFVPGDGMDIVPDKHTLSKYSKNMRKFPCPDPITDISVSICAVVQETKTLLTCAIMHDSMYDPGRACYFFVDLAYPWYLQTGQNDYDRLITDGEYFYLATRSAGRSPFVLNDYSKTKLTTTITDFIKSLCGN